MLKHTWDWDFFLHNALQWSKFSFLHKLDLLLILSIIVLPHYWGNPFPRSPVVCQEVLISDRWLLCYGFVSSFVTWHSHWLFHLRGMLRLVLLAVLTSIIITITAIVRRNEKEAVKMLINLTIGLFDHWEREQLPKNTFVTCLSIENELLFWLLLVAIENKLGSICTSSCMHIDLTTTNAWPEKKYCRNFGEKN